MYGQAVDVVVFLPQEKTSLLDEASWILLLEQGRSGVGDRLEKRCEKERRFM